ncbi:alpha/beta hydrolase [Paraferrimonas sedimenticola]|uniref:Transporter n=1 Tax=Paraferrimonas sedimenticola TaxID=375674 RepID=A0AA37W0R8_9GAMM|nr:alpha/beta hydrolase [Paraferrimonas sedimenticola]GLP95427.1 transporter [Paraferrimonas sedimenticola]
MRVRFSSLLLLLAFFILPASAQTETQTCYVEGLSEKLQCGSVSVPLDHQQPSGDQIDVHYLVLPAIKPIPNQAPLLAIAGGPGQSAIDNAALFDKVFTKVRQTRDILLIDQRGTGQSAMLACDEYSLSQQLAMDDSQVDHSVEIDKCLQQQQYPVRWFDTESGVRDFELVRQALGYPSVHLYGISYGTRAAQVYLKLFPDLVETTTLDGVVPMQQSVIAIGQAIERGFNMLLQDCQENANCHNTYPDLVLRFNDLQARLDKQPENLTVAHPLTAEPSPLTLTKAKLLGALRLAMYSPTTRALIPYAIDAASRDNFQPLLGLISLSSGAGDMAMGMHLSVICAEDFHRIDATLRESLQASYMGREMLKLFDAACPIWDMPPAPEQFSEVLKTDKPVLLLSGQMDPATPPSWGELATVGLTNAKHLVSPYAAHGVAMQTCANRLIADFINAGTLEALELECFDKDTRRSFYLNANSTEPQSFAGESNSDSN